jgi:RNA polymerase sigma-70 factor (ECF subfamily)
MPVLEKKDSLFTGVYSDYFPVVSGSLYTRLGDPQLADDLAQEVFIALYRSFEKVESVRSWLYKTMQNILYDHYRVSMKMPEEQALHEAYDDIGLTFVNGFRDTRIIIGHAIESIPDGIDRVLFDLIAVQNHSYTQAGNHLGLTKRQVYYRYNSIVRHVREHLAERGINSIEDLL